MSQEAARRGVIVPSLASDTSGSAAIWGLNPLGPAISAGQPIGLPGPMNSIQRKVPPYFWGPDAGVVGGGAAVAAVVTGLVAVGAVVAGVVIAGWVTAGVVAAGAPGVVEVGLELQPIRINEPINRTITGIKNFFILCLLEDCL